MFSLPKIIQKLTIFFSTFPGIGQRQATRFVFYLTKQPKEIINNFINLIKELEKEIKLCKNCHFITEKNELCSICSNQSRNHNLICIVEKEIDLISLEKTNQYKGTYFILGGLLFPKSSIASERIKELIDKIKKITKEKTKNIEIILAINPTTQGEATMLYLEKQLKPFNIKVTRLAKGLPMGGSMEYADETTLTNALINRK